MPSTVDLPGEGDSTINIAMFGALGGGCAACLILGIIVGIFVSNKKKSRTENNKEIPLPIVSRGNCISQEIKSKSTNYFCQETLWFKFTIRHIFYL